MRWIWCVWACVLAPLLAWWAAGDCRAALLTIPLGALALILKGTVEAVADT